MFVVIVMNKHDSGVKKLSC